jgi:peptide deformylase
LLEELQKDVHPLKPSAPMALIGKKKIYILHTPSEAVLEIDKDVVSLARRMLATCRAKRGHAIAAVQVGVPLNLVVLDNGQAFVNILVEAATEETVIEKEACLSLPGKVFDVPRFKEIDWSATSLTGTPVDNFFTDFEARMWQHEWDHIQGRLLSDG